MGKKRQLVHIIFLQMNFNWSFQYYYCDINIKFVFLCIVIVTVNYSQTKIKLFRPTTISVIIYQCYKWELLYNMYSEFRKTSFLYYQIFRVKHIFKQHIFSNYLSENIVSVQEI